VTGQHLLLLLWTLWIVFALLSIGDLLGIILALVFGLLGAGLVLTSPATWRGYIIAWLVIHMLAAAYRVAVQRGWLRPQYEPMATGRPGWRTPWDWARSTLLQTIFGSVSFAGLLAVLYLRPTVPWKYSVDIWLVLLVVFVVVTAEYALLGGSWRFKRHEPQPPTDTAPNPRLSAPVSVPVEGKVVRRKRRPLADTEVTNSKRIDGLEFRITNVEGFLQNQQTESAQDGDVQADHPSALENGLDEPPAWFHASGGAQSGEPTTGVVSVELLRIARLTTRHEGSKGVAGRVVGINGMADRVVGIIIERRTVSVSPEQDETVSQVAIRAVEMLSHEIETGAAMPGSAQAISPPDWEVMSARWVQAGLAGINIAGKAVTDLANGLDSILHSEPLQRVFSWNAPGSAAAVIGKDAETKQILAFGGIVVGIRAGQPTAISACFRSLARDGFTRSLAAGIARELSTIGLSRAPTPSSMHRQAG